jgi:hypothetical protein
MAANDINQNLRQIFNIPDDIRSIFTFNNVPKGTPSDFLSTFLARPASFIPKGSQWALVMDDLPTKILPAITLAYSREPGGKTRWDSERAARVILTPDYQHTRGCMFCQAVSIPGEGSTAVVEGGIKHTGLIRSYVGGGRNDFGIMRMSFIDTNISFADSFLRGWALATSHFGMIARENSPKNYRTNATIYKFGITPKGPTVLSSFTLEGLCCISVSEEEANYDPSTNFVRREAQFVYHNYSYNAGSNLDSRIINNSR